MTKNWKDFWNQENRLYVSDRHRDAYYSELHAGLRALLPSKRPLTLLDWGCGDALGAYALRDEGVTVLLHDPVPRVHDMISKRFAGEPGIRVLDTHEVSELQEGEVDVIFIYSVLQYVSKDEFEKLAADLRKLLVPGGLLIIGDIVPSAVSMLDDIGDLVRVSLKHGFFLDAVVGMAVTFFSEYRLIRKSNGFSTYEEAEVLGLLEKAGFDAKRMPRNIGLGRQRMLVVATAR